jgi:Mn-dependent DtxR family transcriptional regulator
MTERPMNLSVDLRVWRLAEHFLASIPGAKPEDAAELAEEIQQRCEDFCRILKNAAHEAGIKDEA